MHAFPARAGALLAVAVAALGTVPAALACVHPQPPQHTRWHRPYTTPSPPPAPPVAVAPPAPAPVPVIQQVTVTQVVQVPVIQVVYVPVPPPAPSCGCKHRPKKTVHKRPHRKPKKKVCRVGRALVKCGDQPPSGGLG